MTAEELKEWADRSERLKAVGESLSGDPRDLVILCAGMLLGLAHRVDMLEKRSRPVPIVGQHVRYVPYPAHGNTSHPDCENGIVTSVRASVNGRPTIFVRFKGDATSQGCHPDQLV